MENKPNNLKNSPKKGFTLLELLIVIAIITILVATVLIVINPSELLKKSRDSKRVSDLNDLKASIEIYLQSQVAPELDGNSSQDLCQDHIWYSLLASEDNGCFDNKICVYPSSTASSTKVDSTGWLPVNFASIQEGSPISNLPLDPKNNSNYYYTYACKSGGIDFELDARLESKYYKDEVDLDGKDGGNAANLYEVGIDPNFSLLPDVRAGFYNGPCKKVGDNCSSDEECSCYSAFCYNGNCKIGIGGSCSSDNDCSSNNCYNGTCKLSGGSNCNSDEQCDSNQCTDNICETLLTWPGSNHTEEDCQEIGGSVFDTGNGTICRYPKDSNSLCAMVRGGWSQAAHWQRYQYNHFQGDYCNRFNGSAPSSWSNEESIYYRTVNYVGNHQPEDCSYGSYLWHVPWGSYDRLYTVGSVSDSCGNSSNWREEIGMY